MFADKFNRFYHQLITNIESDIKFIVDKKNKITMETHNIKSGIINAPRE